MSGLPIEHCPWVGGASEEVWLAKGILWLCLDGLSLAGAKVFAGKLPRAAVVNKGNSAGD